MERESRVHEETLTIIPTCFAFRLPPRSSVGGHKAADWDLESPIWSGRMRMVAIGEVCKVILEDAKGELFAECKITVENNAVAVEPVLDSSRYYVLQLVDEASGRSAFIGLGFNDRAHSFDFKAALQDHLKFVKQQKEIRERPQQPQKHIDLTLKQDQTFNISIKTNSRASPKTSNYANVVDDEDDAGLGFLPPPPGTKQKGTAQRSTNSANSANLLQQPSNTAPTTVAPQNPLDALFQAPTQPQQAQSAPAQDFQFSGFTSGVPVQTNTSSIPWQANTPQQPMQQPQQQPQQPQSADPFAGLFSLGAQQRQPQQQQQQQQQQWGAFAGSNQF